jgi:transcription initiation factor TFIIIB Brf1 subunit/transcription initiation factor TFIIB
MKQYEMYFNQMVLENNNNNNTKTNDDDTLKCKNCKQIQKTITDITTATEICFNCGYICAKLYNTSAEWRFYGYLDDNQHHDPTRCGLPIDELLPKSSLTTKIQFSGTKYQLLMRLHQWNIIHPAERSLYTVFKYMDSIQYNLSCISTDRIALLQAKEYYKILSQKDKCKGTLTRGVIRKSFIAACIYVACQNNNRPLQKTTIASICGITKFDITKGLKKFSILEKNKKIQLNKPNNHLQNIHNFLHLFMIRLNFNQKMKDFAHIICNRLPKLKLFQDTNDISTTAGLLYYIELLFTPHVIKKELIRSKILKIIHTSVVTLQKVYKIIKQHEQYILIGLNIK